MVTVMVKVIVINQPSNPADGSKLRSCVIARISKSSHSNGTWSKAGDVIAYRVPAPVEHNNLGTRQQDDQGLRNPGFQGSNNASTEMSKSKTWHVGRTISSKTLWPRKQRLTNHYHLSRAGNG